jgi:hypothetical protein
LWISDSIRWFIDSISKCRKRIVDPVIHQRQVSKR